MSALAPRRLKRYGDIARLFVKYGRPDFISALKSRGFEIPDAKEQAAPDEPQQRAEGLARDLEEMGPTFVKLGQLLSSRADLLPPAYVESLARLQDEVEPFSFSEVERVVNEELGVRRSHAFAELEPAPLAAASLGQVHRARLRDGRPVAVKVQRPGIREQIAEDLEILRSAAEILDEHSSLGAEFEMEKIVEEFGRSLAVELDYRAEARHLKVLGRNLREFDRIVVPAPIDDYTSERVLTMELVEGRRITDLSPLLRMDVDGSALADQLFRAYLKQILVDGFFHADPHPGNVLLTGDGRLALLDLGMVARITPELRERLFRLLLAVSDSRGEEAADLALEIGVRREGCDENAFRRAVGRVVGQAAEGTLADMQIGRIVLSVARAAGEAGVRLPAELTMLGKTLLQLDQVGRALDPDFDPNSSIRENSAELVRQGLGRSATTGAAFTALLETRRLLERLPGRIERILEVLSRNELRVRVDAIDERELIAGLQKIANRIAVGLVLAALIVGAAILMQVPTRFQIFGYPGLAILLFLAAAAGGFLLVGSIVASDRKPKR